MLYSIKSTGKIASFVLEIEFVYIACNEEQASACNRFNATGQFWVITLMFLFNAFIAKMETSNKPQGKFSYFLLRKISIYHF